MNNVFLICPVRNSTEDQKSRIDQYIKNLEEHDIKVYYPARDTDQIDSIGFRICSDNKRALTEASEIHVWYDPNSQGSIFDLGMAFALDKKITIANVDDLKFTHHKSITNMLYEWSLKEA